MRSRFGVLLAQTGSWASMVEQARAVEAAGFDSLWVADQFANPFTASDWLEGWTALAGLAVVTERIRIGTLVTNVIYNHPGLIAKQAITVDHMSGGRLDLGIGAGGAPTDHSMTGVPYWSGPERQRRFAEFVAIVEQLLTQRTSSFAGEFHSFEDAYVSPAPAQAPRMPLVLAAHGPKSMRLAAERADTWSFYEPGSGLTGAAATDAIQRMNGYVDEQAQAAGRDPAAITRSFCCGFAAASVWQSLDEACAGIRACEAVGVNEFIVTYSPEDGFGSGGDLVTPTGEVPSAVLLRSPDDLQSFAREMLS